MFIWKFSVGFLPGHATCKETEQFGKRKKLFLKYAVYNIPPSAN